VAAGDAFNGGLAAALVEGLPYRRLFGVRLRGALLATEQGAQSAVCDRQTPNRIYQMASPIRDRRFETR